MPLSTDERGLTSVHLTWIHAGELFVGGVINNNTIMKLLNPSVLVVLTLVAGNCVGPAACAANPRGYDLTSPNAIYTLPAALREISALAYVDPMTLVCVEDEHGVLYTYNPTTSSIATQMTFSAEGDYEGVARVAQTMYVLRSDARLFEVTGYSSKAPRVKVYETQIPAKDSEGLCYDATRHRLLIAAKSKSGNGAEFKDKRMVYEFDLKTMSMREEPAFTFDPQKITEFAQHSGIALPQQKKTKKGGAGSPPVVNLMPSAIGVHPITGQLYLLSASSHLLLVFNMDGTVEDIELLDPKLFNKAEGITFNEKGDLFISNEGEDKPATILRFKLQEQ